MTLVQSQVGLLFFWSVAGQAVSLQQRQNVLLEIDLYLGCRGQATLLLSHCRIATGGAKDYHEKQKRSR